MTTDELVAAVAAIYAKYGVPDAGVYLDERECTAPCCYDDHDRDVAAVAALGDLPLVFGASVGYLPSLDSIACHHKRRTCTHSWHLKGRSSQTSAGTMDWYECSVCGSGRYQPVGASAPR